MKSELKQPKVKAKVNEIVFPVLARFKCGAGTPRTIDQEKIVMFTGLTEGVCVWGRYENSVGGNHKNWIPVSDEQYWEILPSGVKVVLSN